MRENVENLHDLYDQLQPNMTPYQKSQVDRLSNEINQLIDELIINEPPMENVQRAT